LKSLRHDIGAEPHPYNMPLSPGEKYDAIEWNVLISKVVPALF
jgi:hypothetical protein